MSFVIKFFRLIFDTQYRKKKIMFLLKETEVWDRWVAVHIGKIVLNIAHVAILNFDEIHPSATTRNCDHFDRSSLTKNINQFDVSLRCEHVTTDDLPQNFKKIISYYYISPFSRPICPFETNRFPSITWKYCTTGSKPSSCRIKIILPGHLLYRSKSCCHIDKVVRPLLRLCLL